MSELQTERRLRRKLSKYGYRLRKTPARSWMRQYYSPGFIITDQSNTVCFGCWTREYEATLEDVTEFTKCLQSL